MPLWSSSEARDLSNQLLFGEAYEVLFDDVSSPRILIRGHFDQKQGWIDRMHHHAIQEDYFQQLISGDYKISTEVSTSLLFNKSPLNVLIGSILPIASNELFRLEEQFAFAGEAKNLHQKRDIGFLKSMTEKYLGAPYLKGGKSPFGIDDIGLLGMLYKITGFNVYRLFEGLISGQYQDQPEPGAMLCFENLENGRRPFQLGVLLDEEQLLIMHSRVIKVKWHSGSVWPNTKDATQLYPSDKALPLRLKGSKQVFLS